MGEENQLKSLIFRILGEKIIAFNPILARITGSVKAGLFLSQLLYWWGKEKKHGWIYKTIEEFEEETALSREEQDVAIKRLKQLGILEVEIKGIPPKRHFRVNEDKLLNLCKTHDSICVKPTNKFVGNPQINLCKTHKLIHKNTTENTTENTIKDINNNNNISNDKIVAGNSSLEETSGKRINELISYFKSVNPNYERLYPNKTQREALARLVKKYGEEKIRWLLGSLPQIVIKPYAPRITTPYQLEQKFAELLLFLTQEKNKGGGMVDARELL